MIYRYVSSKEMIAKVFRDLKPSGSDWEADVIEWIGEALEFIGSGAAFELKQASLKVSNFRAAIPCDLLELKHVFNGSAPMHWGRNTETDIALSSSKTNDTVISKSGTIFRTGSNVSKNSGGYFINGGYIICPSESGEIYIEYEGLKTDEDGYPMIPNAVHYRNAIFLYILRQMIMGGYKHSDQQLTYFNVDQMWKKACAQASVKGGFPSVDKWNEFGRKFVSLLPTIRTVQPLLQNPEKTETPVVRSVSELKPVEDQKADITNTLMNFIVSKISELYSVQLDESLPVLSGVRTTGVDSGLYGQISLTDDYVYICVQEGVPGQAIWKRFVLFKS